MHRATLYLCLTAPLALAGCTGAQSPAAPADVSATTAAAPAASDDGAVSASTKGGRAGTSGYVYVTGQGLYYDTFATADPLPMHGRFQKLENGATQYGPGDPGYLGGRWWVDENGNDVQDEGDHFFLCPLLPPGRTTP